MTKKSWLFLLLDTFNLVTYNITFDYGRILEELRYINWYLWNNYELYKMTQIIWKHALRQCSANFFQKGPDSTYFSLGGIHGFGRNYSRLPLYPQSNHSQCIKELSWLCSNKTLFLNTVTGHTLLSLALKIQWSTPILRTRKF